VAETFPRRQRGAARGRAAALSIAIAGHLVFLVGLVLGVRPEAPRPPTIADVIIVPDAFRLAPRSLPPSISPAPRLREQEHPAIKGPFNAASAARAPVSGAAGNSRTADLAALGAALRASGMGCGLEGARLTTAEREACHERLGAGAANAAYITAVPPEKRAYYAALQAREAEMAHDPLGGHAPGIVCGKDAQTKGFKLGRLACAFTPSPSPWAPELDVRPP
jgi:hypothetical protein